MRQGTSLDWSEADPERVSLFRLEDIGLDETQIVASPFFSTVLGAKTDEPFPADRFQECVTSMHTNSHNARGSTSAAHTVLVGDAAGDATGSTAGGAAGSSAGNAAQLPSEGELEQTLRGDHALMLSLCQHYAQDSLCLAAQYDMPSPCAELFELPSARSGSAAGIAVSAVSKEVAMVTAAVESSSNGSQQPEAEQPSVR